MKVVRVVVGGVVALLVAACGPGETIPGTAAGVGETTTVAETSTAERTTEAEATTTRVKITLPNKTAETTRDQPSEPGGLPPSTVDESLPSQYCERTFTGALGKPMHAVVVETPGGILNCEEAAAILFDYYVERPEPEFGLAPYFIGPLACNQAEEGQFPQVICADEDNLIYSMWPQT
ncbi:hypothetical protein ACFPM7_23065 [Actinokineospora guangxiensis]|uniref:Subtilisin inhibitor-like n=1 Tax=Actinokineospora guangxiensis TaxID=1490288 RepID=A0ABW0ERL3_9PSEU